MMLDVLLGQRVDVTRQRVFKFFPNNPPERGEVVLVDGVRHRVTRSRVRWNRSEWRLLLLRVKPTDGSRTLV